MALSMLGSSHGTADMFKQVTYLNRQQEYDIEEMFTSIPALKSGLNATEGWAFCHPPEVEWDSLSEKEKAELKQVLEEYYVPFRWEAYVRGMIKYGILPWTVKQVGRNRYVPVCPKIGTGAIRQYYDYDEKEMVYEWMWLKRPGMIEPDESMRFQVWSAPDIDGNYTSPAVACLRSWKMAKIASRAGERAMHHGANMPYFLVHNPPKGRPGDEKLSIPFGEVEELGMARDAHNRVLEQAQMSRNSLYSAIHESRANNRGFVSGNNALASSLPVLNSESLSDREGREGNGVLDRLVGLDDYWTIASAQPPVLLGDPIAYEQRNDQIAASLVDFPLSMVIEQHAQHAGNFDAQVTFARDRMKAVITKMNAFLRNVILECEQEMIGKRYVVKARAKTAKAGRPLSEEELLEIRTAEKNMRVVQVCTPLINLESIERLFELGVMGQQFVLKQTAHLFGLPAEEMEVTPLKRLREIEMEKVELSKEAESNQLVLGEKKLKIDAKKAEQPPKPAAKKK